MKVFTPFAPFKDNVTFEYWSPTFGQDVNGEITITYSFGGDYSGLLIPKQAGMFQLVTKTQMELDGEVRNVVDSAGTPIFIIGTDPYVMFVDTVDAILDIYGNLGSWRHNLQRSVSAIS